MPASGFRRVRQLLLVGIGTATAGCAGGRLVYGGCQANPSACPELAPSAVEAVVFLAGDAGYLTFDNNPVLQHLRSQVASASDDVPVTVLFLGDNVYPNGVRAGVPRDIELLEAQVKVVGGTSAKAYFLAGNHDWAGGVAGFQLLERQDSLLRNSDDRDTISVELIPRPGCPGPVGFTVTNSRQQVLARILGLDSQWSLMATDAQSGCDSGSGEESLRRLGDSLANAGDEFVIVAAHHPLVTAGLHGGAGPLHRRLGHWAGLIGQDVNVGPYGDFIDGLSSALSRGSGTTIYAAGHEHSLQVIDTEVGARPLLQLVSGSGSKRTPVKSITGGAFIASLRGYMRLDFGPGSRVVLTVIAGCVDEDGIEPEDRAAVQAVLPSICGPDAANELNSVYSRQIR